MPDVESTIDRRDNKYLNGKDITKSKYYKYFIPFLLISATAMALFGTYELFYDLKHAYFLFFGLAYIFYAIFYSRPRDLKAKRIKDISLIGKISLALTVLCMLITIIWMFFYMPSQHQPALTPAVVITPAMALLAAVIAVVLGVYVFLMKKILGSRVL